MVLHSPMLTHRLPIDFDLYVALYQVGGEILTIAGVWSCALLMVLIQHLLKRFHTAKAGEPCDDERRRLRCN